jgi:hypothetical protein
MFFVRCFFIYILVLILYFARHTGNLQTKKNPDRKVSYQAQSAVASRSPFGNINSNDTQQTCTNNTRLLLPTTETAILLISMLTEDRNPYITTAPSQACANKKVAR